MDERDLRIARTHGVYAQEWTKEIYRKVEEVKKV
jgi:hypothetical protein